MTTTTAHAPPPPQPPFPPATLPHRRHRASSSSSSSFSLSTASSSTSTSPSPSPRHSTTSASVVVPFSWEHHPGIPKTSSSSSSSGDHHPHTAPASLPLPPHLRSAPTNPSRHHRRLRHGHHCGANNIPPPSSDPFAAALAECTRDRAAAIDDLFAPAKAPAPAKPPPSSRRWSIAAAGGGVVGLLDLYGCKSAMAVADGAFVMRRPVAVARPAGGPGRVGQGRAGRAGR